MTKVYLFSQNLKIESLSKISDVNVSVEHVFLTTHCLFDYEKDYIKLYFSNPTFIFYGNILNDNENEQCDFDAFKYRNNNVSRYYDKIKFLKNKKILDHIKSRYSNIQGYLLCDDLGIDKNVWLTEGFKNVCLEYYFVRGSKTSLITKIKNNVLIHRFYNIISRDILHLHNENLTKDIYIAYFNNHKYVFIGRPSRISYRMNVTLEKSQDEYERLSSGRFESSDKCTYLTTLHESGKNMIPDKKNYDVRYIQDGYLPTNYSSKYLCFKPKNVSYYAWDLLGKEIFNLQQLPVSLMPFRKKLFLPKIKKRNVKTILVATSGPGDWTAQKNRSDEDLMIICFVEIARCFPDIRIIYRCHPTWTHPKHNGINSINRIATYIEKSKVPNLFLSANIPQNDLENFNLSFSRNSINEDFKSADLVLGEHSISMIDAALLGIPFVSVNLTNRRNLFEGITQFGFPHCTSIDDVKMVIKRFEDLDFVNSYNEAIKKYNEMTSKDC